MNEISLAKASKLFWFRDLRSPTTIHSKEKSFLKLEGYEGWEVKSVLNPELPVAEECLWYSYCLL
jgi:hypothetical protein